MKLIGNFLSPFSRRVAISLNVLNISYEIENILAFDNAEKIQPYNPLVRVPTLILDDGEVLIESYAILDYLDESVVEKKRLIPKNGPGRRRVMKDTAIGVGSMDRAQWAAYEYRHRPQEKVHEPWVQHNDAKALAGLHFLDGLAAFAGTTGWLSGSKDITQSDITAVVAYSFIEKFRPGLSLAEDVPSLSAFAQRCESMPHFLAAPVPS